MVGPMKSYVLAAALLLAGLAVPVTGEPVCVPDETGVCPIDTDDLPGADDVPSPEDLVPPTCEEGQSPPDCIPGGETPDPDTVCAEAGVAGTFPTCLLGVADPSALDQLCVLGDDSLAFPECLTESAPTAPGPCAEGQDPTPEAPCIPAAPEAPCDPTSAPEACVPAPPPTCEGEAVPVVDGCIPASPIGPPVGDQLVASFSFEALPVAAPAIALRGDVTVTASILAGADYAPYSGPVSLFLQRDCGGLEPALATTGLCQAAGETVAAVAGEAVDGNATFVVAAADLRDDAFIDGTPLSALHVFVQAGDAYSHFLAAANELAALDPATVDQVESMGFTPVLVVDADAILLQPYALVTPLNSLITEGVALVGANAGQYRFEVATSGATFTEWRLAVLGVGSSLEPDPAALEYTTGTTDGVDLLANPNDGDGDLTIAIPSNAFSIQGRPVGGLVVQFVYVDAEGAEVASLYSQAAHEAAAAGEHPVAARLAQLPTAAVFVGGLLGPTTGDLSLGGLQECAPACAPPVSPPSPVSCLVNAEDPTLCLPAPPACAAPLPCAALECVQTAELPTECAPPVPECADPLPCALIACLQGGTPEECLPEGPGAPPACGDGQTPTPQAPCVPGVPEVGPPEELDCLDEDPASCVPAGPPLPPVSPPEGCPAEEAQDVCDLVPAPSPMQSYAGRVRDALNSFFSALLL